MDKVYEFNGAIRLFDRIIAQNYTAQTTAPSVLKARSNIAYRYKRDNGYAKTAKISLTGKFTIIEQKEGM